MTIRQLRAASRQLANGEVRALLRLAAVAAMRAEQPQGIYLACAHEEWETLMEAQRKAAAAVAAPPRQAKGRRS